jgi:steroid Delta-isomerase
MTTHADTRVARVIELFETLREDKLAELATLYAPGARFKDPFNDVAGVPAIQHIFGHMFKSLDGPRFVITEAVAQGNQVFLTWDFHFRMRRFNSEPQLIRGSSHLRFAPDGRVSLHRDYWDAAEELYEKLPLLGALMRWLKKRANR